MPRRARLHVGVGRRTRTTENGVGDTAIPVTCDEPIQAVPPLSVVLRPGMQRWLVGKRESGSVRSTNAVVKAEPFCRIR